MLRVMPWTPRALIDFDGVIHRYSKGWHDGTAYDPPMPGAQGAINVLMQQGREVVVFSTRDADQIHEWLRKWGFPPLRVTNVKEPAQFILDDRALRFETWELALGDVNDLYPMVEQGI